MDRIPLHCHSEYPLDEFKQQAEQLAKSEIDQAQKQRHYTGNHNHHDRAFLDVVFGWPGHGFHLSDHFVKKALDFFNYEFHVFTI